jgi:hypothetical protein
LKKGDGRREFHQVIWASDGESKFSSAFWKKQIRRSKLC